MESRSKNLSEWAVSGALHALLGAVVLTIALLQHLPKATTVDITVLESPRVSPKAVEMREPPPPKKIEAPRQVFGQTKRALTAPSTDKNAVQVKAGNTIAKEQDQTKLRDDDAQSLPVPTDEYLVSQMPELAGEVRVPYPPGARARRVQGAVILDILIDATGTVRDAKFVQGPDPELNDAALTAVKSFKFRPAQVQDKAVAVRIRYAYRFVLEN